MLFADISATAKGSNLSLSLARARRRGGGAGAGLGCGGAAERVVAGGGAEVGERKWIWGVLSACGGEKESGFGALGEKEVGRRMVRDMCVRWGRA
jgi:hypothetical protein